MIKRPPPVPGDPLAEFARPLALTRAAMAAERLLRAFWPALVLAALTFTALAFRLQDLLSPRLASTAAGLAAFALALAVGAGLRGLRLPSRAEALARLDAGLPGQPLSALSDRMVLGRGDPAAEALWLAHLRRMAAQARAARAPLPQPELAPRDPFGLRLSALTAATVALIFGAPFSIFQPVTRSLPVGPAEAAIGPAWEGWAEPPRYTGKPGLYLNSFEPAEVFLPEGTRFSFRFYGAPGTVAFSETLSDPAAPPQATGSNGGSVDGSGGDSGGGVQALEFSLARSGRLEIGNRQISVVMLSDDPPTVELPRLAERRADGKLAQPYHASDDYGVARGEAQISLDLAAVDRRFGLATEPEPREDLIYDLPLPLSGGRDDFVETLVEDAARHPWANLPVTISLRVEDGLGQFGFSGAQSFELPGRRFFDPRAAALIEMRRDILWNRANAAQSAQVLRAISNRPEDLFPSPLVAPALRSLIEELESAALSGDERDMVAHKLWELAELLEDGGLADALAAMQQAQERLSEAIRNGASKDEIAKLMAELKEATDRYVQMLAERSQQEEEGPQFGRQPESQQITGDQIQAMMDEIQRLMEEGRMAEAQELLDQLARMMENLRVTQGEGGEGDTPGGRAMRDLGETLRNQQELSDEAFREMQRGTGPGEEGEAGKSPDGAEGSGAEGTGPEGAGPQEAPDREGLAGRQRGLSRELERQRGLMPRLQGEAAEEARRTLDEAGRAMEGAERALRDGNMGEAIDRQADAIEALREGMRALGEALAEENGQAGRGPGREGEERLGDATGGQGNREMPRDPLGRESGQNGMIDRNGKLPDGSDAFGRARNLLDEIRRRSAERLRPEAERDYLRRLLDRF